MRVCALFVGLCILHADTAWNPEAQVIATKITGGFNVTPKNIRASARQDSSISDDFADLAVGDGKLACAFMKKMAVQVFMNRVCEATCPRGRSPLARVEFPSVVIDRREPHQVHVGTFA